MNNDPHLEFPFEILFENSVFNPNEDGIFEGSFFCGEGVKLHVNVTSFFVTRKCQKIRKIDENS